MKSIVQAIVLLALLGGTCNCPLAYGQQVSIISIPRNANVFIDPTNGFDGSELKAALLKEGVPLDIVSNRRMADFEITGSIQSTQESLFLSVRILNVKTRDLAWGYGVAGFADSQGAAALCAKQLNHEMRRKH
jgi:hypothetical protein